MRTFKLSAFLILLCASACATRSLGSKAEQAHTVTGLEGDWQVSVIFDANEKKFYLGPNCDTRAMQVEPETLFKKFEEKIGFKEVVKNYEDTQKAVNDLKQKADMQQDRPDVDVRAAQHLEDHLASLQQEYNAVKEQELEFRSIFRMVEYPICTVESTQKLESQGKIARREAFKFLFSVLKSSDSALVTIAEQSRISKRIDLRASNSDEWSEFGNEGSKIQYLAQSQNFFLEMRFPKENNTYQFIPAQTGNKHFSDIVFNDGQVIGAGELPTEKSYACVLRIQYESGGPFYFSSSKDALLFNSPYNRVQSNFLRVTTSDEPIRAGGRQYTAELKCGLVSFTYETVTKGTLLNKTKEQVRTDQWKLLETSSDASGSDSIYALTLPKIIPANIGLSLVK